LKRRRYQRVKERNVYLRAMKLGDAEEVKREKYRPLKAMNLGGWKIQLSR